LEAQYNCNEERANNLKPNLIEFRSNESLDLKKHHEQLKKLKDKIHKIDKRFSNERKQECLSHLKFYCWKILTAWTFYSQQPLNWKHDIYLELCYYYVRDVNDNNKKFIKEIISNDLLPHLTKIFSHYFENITANNLNLEVLRKTLVENEPSNNKLKSLRDDQRIINQR
jgi:hypothetical protein